MYQIKAFIVHTMVGVDFCTTFRGMSRHVFRTPRRMGVVVPKPDYTHPTCATPMMASW
jgi:hypothetical protein